MHRLLWNKGVTLVLTAAIIIDPVAKAEKEMLRDALIQSYSFESQALTEMGLPFTQKLREKPNDPGTPWLGPMMPECSAQEPSPTAYEIGTDVLKELLVQTFLQDRKPERILEFLERLRRSEEITFPEAWGPEDLRESATIWIKSTAGFISTLSSRLPEKVLSVYVVLGDAAPVDPIPLLKKTLSLVLHEFPTKTSGSTEPLPGTPLTDQTKALRFLGRKDETDIKIALKHGGMSTNEIERISPIISSHPNRERAIADALIEELDYTPDDAGKTALHIIQALIQGIHLAEQGPPVSESPFLPFIVSAIGNPLERHLEFIPFPLKPFFPESTLLNDWLATSQEIPATNLDHQSLTSYALSLLRLWAWIHNGEDGLQIKIIPENDGYRLAIIANEKALVAWMIFRRESDQTWRIEIQRRISTRRKRLYDVLFLEFLFLFHNVPLENRPTLILSPAARINNAFLNVGHLKLSRFISTYTRSGEYWSCLLRWDWQTDARAMLQKIKGSLDSLPPEFNLFQNDLLMKDFDDDSYGENSAILAAESEGLPPPSSLRQKASHSLLSDPELYQAAWEGRLTARLWLSLNPKLTRADALLYQQILWHAGIIEWDSVTTSSDGWQRASRLSELFRGLSPSGTLRGLTDPVIFAAARDGYLSLKFWNSLPLMSRNSRAQKIVRISEKLGVLETIRTEGEGKDNARIFQFTDLFAPSKSRLIETGA